MHPTLLIRPSAASDVPAITAIYGWNVLNGTGHCDIQLRIDGSSVGTFVILPSDGLGPVLASFDFGAVFAPGSQFDLYFAFPLSPETNRWGNTMAMIGRLKPGVSAAQAQAEIRTIAEQLTRDNPRRNAIQGHVKPLAEQVTEVKPGDAITVKLTAGDQSTTVAGIQLPWNPDGTRGSSTEATGVSSIVFASMTTKRLVSDAASWTNVSRKPSSSSCPPDAGTRAQPGHEPFGDQPAPPTDVRLVQLARVRGTTDDLEQVRHELRTAVRKVEPVLFEHRIRSADGSFRCISCRALPVGPPNGR